jgi:flagellar basal body-associated protein FliL
MIRTLYIIMKKIIIILVIVLLVIGGYLWWRSAQEAVPVTNEGAVETVAPFEETPPVETIPAP